MMHKSFQGGYILLVETILFIAISVIVVVGVVNPLLSGYASTQSFVRSGQALLTADSALDEALYRLKNGKTMPASLNLSLASTTATINITTISGGQRITTVGQNRNYARNIQADVRSGTGISFHFGVQSGKGGFTLANSSQITGDVYSDGTISGAGNNIYGNAISASSTGLINNVHVTGSAYAHTITNSTIDKDAYYVTKTGTTVLGTSYPNSPDQGNAALPISDAQIAQWEADAAAGGIRNCSGTYTIQGTTTVTLGPEKITCNLNIRSSTVTINGPLWVTGNITVEQSSLVKISPSLGSQNVPIIADNPADRSGSSIIQAQNTTQFQGSGSAGSFVFLISQNNNAEGGGSTDAITVQSAAEALVVYAAHGKISLSQSVNLRQATAYKIAMANSAKVTYDTSLPNTLFAPGASSSANFDQIEWGEI
jgi:hypothetical protein